MGKRPKITITLVEKREAGQCHHGHQVGDTFNFDTDRGIMCPMMMHTAFPYIDILRYGGTVPGEDSPDTCLFSCPDPRVLNIFRIERITEKE